MCPIGSPFSIQQFDYELEISIAQLESTVPKSSVDNLIVLV